MPDSNLAYFDKEDILHLSISAEPESQSIELSPNITAELNGNGELIGIEILNASDFIRNSVVDSAQAKLLQLFNPPENRQAQKETAIKELAIL